MMQTAQSARHTDMPAMAVHKAGITLEAKHPVDTYKFSPPQTLLRCSLHTNPSCLLIRQQPSPRDCSAAGCSIGDGCMDTNADPFSASSMQTNLTTLRAAFCKLYSSTVEGCSVRKQKDLYDMMHLGHTTLIIATVLRPLMINGSHGY